MHEIESSVGTNYSKSIVVLQSYRVILYVLRWLFACLLAALGLTFIARTVTGYAILDHALYFLLFANVLAFGFYVPGVVHETEHLFEAIRVDYKIKLWVVRVPFGFSAFGEDVETMKNIDEVDTAKKESYYQRLFNVMAAPYVSIVCNMAWLMLILILFIVAWQSPWPLNVILFFITICGYTLVAITPVALMLVLKRKRSNRYLVRLASVLTPECYELERIVFNDMATMDKLHKEYLKEYDTMTKMIASGELVGFGHIASIPVCVPHARIYVPSKNR